MKIGRVTRKKPYDTIYDTPKRAKVQCVFQYLAAKGILYTDREIIKFFGVEEGPGRRSRVYPRDFRAMGRVRIA